jgi:excisionase family DNA binding protein
LREAAELTGLSVFQFKRAIAEGVLPAKVIGVNRMAIMADDLRQWLEDLPRVKPKAAAGAGDG